MIALWMVYASSLVGVLAWGAARATESILRRFGLATRPVWVAALQGRARRQAGNVGLTRVEIWRSPGVAEVLAYR